MFPVGGFSGTMNLRAFCGSAVEWQSGGGFGVCFCFQGRGNGRVGKKYRTNQGWLQSSKLQNLNVKMISGEMNVTEMKWSVGAAKRNR